MALTVGGAIGNRLINGPPKPPLPAPDPEPGVDLQAALSKLDAYGESLESDISARLDDARRRIKALAGPDAKSGRDDVASKVHWCLGEIAHEVIGYMRDSNHKVLSPPETAQTAASLEGKSDSVDQWLSEVLAIGRLHARATLIKIGNLDEAKLDVPLGAYTAHGRKLVEIANKLTAELQEIVHLASDDDREPTAQKNSNPGISDVIGPRSLGRIVSPKF